MPSDTFGQVSRIILRSVRTHISELLCYRRALFSPLAPFNEQKLPPVDAIQIVKDQCHRVLPGQESSAVNCQNSIELFVYDTRILEEIFTEFSGLLRK